MPQCGRHKLWQSRMGNTAQATPIRSKGRNSRKFSDTTATPLTSKLAGIDLAPLNKGLASATSRQICLQEDALIDGGQHETPGTVPIQRLSASEVEAALPNITKCKQLVLEMRPSSRD